MAKIQKVTVNGSKLVKMKDGGEMYLCYGDNDQMFWSAEKLGAGQVVALSERKKGEKYLDRDGKEQEIKKDGFNLEYVMGDLAAVQSIKATKAALAEMD